MTLAVHSAIIKAVEAELIAAAPADFLMQQAAQHLADFICALIAAQPTPAQVVVAAGGGGNGGDGLYAAALLATAGHQTAALLWHPAGAVHEPAYAAALHAGCEVHSREEIAALAQQKVPAGQRLILVDAIQGLGSTPLSTADAELWHSLEQQADTVVAVDLPTGIAVDSGAAPAPVTTPTVTTPLPRHVTADYTVTFGPLRLAHALSTACGTVFHADITGAAGESLLAMVSDAAAVDAATTLPTTTAAAASAAPAPPATATAATTTNAPAVIECHLAWQNPEPSLQQTALKQWDGITLTDLTPASSDHKYTRGVPTVVAGSTKYPGAAVLSTYAAVQTGAGMVRYAGDCAAAVIARCPEVVLEPDLAAIKETDCWVFGPGVGTSATAAATLRELIHTPQPLIIDADGLTLLAGSQELQQQLQQRPAPTVLTPHAGEFERLTGKRLHDPAAEAVALAAQLRATVLLKGRKTLIATPAGQLTVVDAGNSWAATAGSGDVLAGILATNCARAKHPDAVNWIIAAVATHAVAAQKAATTACGAAPTSASQIAAAIPEAQALLQRSQIQPPK